MRASERRDLYNMNTKQNVRILDLRY